MLNLFTPLGTGLGPPFRAHAMGGCGAPSSRASGRRVPLRYAGMRRLVSASVSARKWFCKPLKSLLVSLSSTSTLSVELASAAVRGHPKEEQNPLEKQKITRYRHPHMSAPIRL
jgi:hypothetical protein